MSPSACKKKTEVISVVCSLSLKQLPQDVKALEEKIVAVVNQAGRQFYGAVFAAYQQQWLQQRRGEYRAERWREIDQVTPFGLIRLPVRVVRCRSDGHYLTLSRLLRPKATRLLSPWVEKRAAGSGHQAELPTGGSGAVALDASASERVADLALRAISRSEVERAA
jgi:hypothetical protein